MKVFIHNINRRSISINLFKLGFIFKMLQI